MVPGLELWVHARSAQRAVRARLESACCEVAAAEFITPIRGSKLPIFEDTASGVTLVRSVVGPNTKGGLEVVRIGESTGREGIALVRWRTPLAPFGLGGVSASQLNFHRSRGVAPRRSGFRFPVRPATDRGRTPGKISPLPSVVRFLVSDQTTGRTLAVSTATMVHVELPADCAGQGVPGFAVRNSSLMPTVRDLPWRERCAGFLSRRRHAAARCPAALHSITRALLFA
jgi:general secretion pathway protein J